MLAGLGAGMRAQEQAGAMVWPLSRLWGESVEQMLVGTMPGKLGPDFQKGWVVCDVNSPKC